VTAASPSGPIIEICLAPPLEAIVEDAGRERFEHAVQTRIAAVMESYGIPGEPRTVTGGTCGFRAMRVAIGDTALPCPPGFVRRLWFKFAPPALHGRAFASCDPYTGDPDAWLCECASGAGSDVRRAVEDVITYLPEDIVGLRPSTLLTVVASGLSAESLALRVAAALLDRGLALPPMTELARLADQHSQAGRSDAATIEDLYAGLRAPTIELHVHPDEFARLAGHVAARAQIDDEHPHIDAQTRAAFRAVRTHRLVGLGVREPLELVASGELDPDELRIKLNNRLGPPIPIPRENEVGVSAPASAVRDAGIAARPLIDAVSGHALAAINGEDAPQAEALGFAVASRTAFIAAACGRAITPLAHRILSIDEVEADLAVVEELFPSLVHGALSRCGLARIVQLLRDLVSEQVSIGDLWGVLNAMLRFADARSRVLYREKSGRALDVEPANNDDRVELLQFVRRELGDRVAYDSGALNRVSAGALSAYVTGVTLEQRMARFAPGPVPWREAEAIRAQVWRALGPSPAAEPVFVTDESCRPALRDVLAYELPAARVLARTEIPPEVDVSDLATIELD